MTLADRLQKNVELLAAAGRELACKPTRDFAVSVVKPEPDQWEIDCPYARDHQAGSVSSVSAAAIASSFLSCSINTSGSAA
jgi:hypothetical protein